MRKRDRERLIKEALKAGVWDPEGLVETLEKYLKESKEKERGESHERE